MSAGMLVRRTPPGVRELKLVRHHLLPLVLLRRTPPGVRELKHLQGYYYRARVQSHPSRGA